MLKYFREGDTVRGHPMDRLARGLGDLVALVRVMTDSGVTVEFATERLTFVPGKHDHCAAFQMHVLGAVAKVERPIIRTRQAEGTAEAKARGVYTGGKPSLTLKQIEHARTRAAAAVPKAAVACDLGVARQTLYDALAGRGTYAQAS